jgi:hypothetical protein
VETSYPETYPPLGIRYTSSSDGVTWGEPHFLVEGPYADPEILAVNESELHVVWSGTATDRFKFHTWSTDSGMTWREIWRNDKLGGIQGSPALVVDSLGRIYWLKVGTVFALSDDVLPNKDSLHENIFRNGSWSVGNILLTGSSKQNNMGNVTAVITPGNQIILALTYPLPKSNESYQFDIFYMNKMLSIPTSHVRSLPTATAFDLEFTSDAQSDHTPTVTTNSLLNLDPTPSLVWSDWMSVLAGLLPASLLTLTIIFLSRRRK